MAAGHAVTAVQERGHHCLVSRSGHLVRHWSAVARRWPRRPTWRARWTRLISVSRDSTSATGGRLAATAAPTALDCLSLRAVGQPQAARDADTSGLVAHL